MNTTVKLYLRQNHKVFIFLPTRIFRRRQSTFNSDQNIISLLESCNTTSQLTQVHGLMVKTGLDTITFTLSKLLAHSIQDAHYASAIFTQTQSPNLFMYNTMLRAYSISNDPRKALVLFNHLRAENRVAFLDQFSFVTTLKSCAELKAIETGICVHSLVLRTGFDWFINVRNTLLSFYCALGIIQEARQLFDEVPRERDLVSWNTLMGGYLRVSQYSGVILLFRELRRDGVFSVNSATILSSLSAFGDLGNVPGGECLHGFCVKVGLLFDLNVISALIWMYGKMGCIGFGRKFFDEVCVKDVVLWNCLVDGYAKNNMLREALGVLRLMKMENVKPNSSTLAGLISACGASGALSVGDSIYSYVEEQHLVLDAILGTALVDMYCKCGLLWKAIIVFDMIANKDVKCWTAMISGYGVHGQAKNAVNLLLRMEEEGHRPNKVTFLAVLSACSHGGLVTEGTSCFRKMVLHYGLTPQIEHYGCMIDLLGRAGLLDEAHTLIRELPVEEDATAWRALLAACRVHGNVELGERVKRELEEVYNEQHPADSLVLTSTYAIAGRMQDHTDMGEKLEGLSVKETRLTQTGKKEAGCSTVVL